MHFRDTQLLKRLKICGLIGGLLFMASCYAKADATEFADRDILFLKSSARLGLFAVQVVDLARTRTQRQQIGQFANRWLLDQTQINKRLEQIVPTKMMQMPDTPSETQIGILRKLKAVKPADFDPAFLQATMSLLKHEINFNIKDELQYGRNTHVKQLAEEMKVTYERMLLMMRAISGVQSDIVNQEVTLSERMQAVPEATRQMEEAVYDIQQQIEKVVAQWDNRGAVENKPTQKEVSQKIVQIAADGRKKIDQIGSHAQQKIEQANQSGQIKPDAAESKMQQLSYAISKSKFNIDQAEEQALKKIEASHSGKN